MKRRALLAAAALGAAAVVGCTDPAAPTDTIGFRQPAALAVFRGLTSHDRDAIRPYLAVANAARNDLTLVDARDDTRVWADVPLRAAVVPVAERPALLASASLGDGGADLLVAVSAGDSALQLVRTWTVDTAVVAEIDLAAELGLGAVDVVALATLPSATGTARVAAALSNRRVALLAFRRGEAGAIDVAGAPTASAELAFQPLALAAMPGPADQTAIYAATTDALSPGVYGVAEISADLGTVRALDARGPTRLVAALRLVERDADSSSKDGDAFTGGSAVPRVYAVLDESGCGDDRRVPCGVVTIDPVTGSIPPDASGVMAYRAPIPIPGRPLAIAVSPPPKVPPDAAHPEWAEPLMRLMGGALEQTTTGVGLVASDDGRVYFLDLGRYKLATAGSALAGLSATALAPAYEDGKRLWLKELATEAFAPSSPAPSAASEPPALRVTAGYTPSEGWSVAYQAPLPRLLARTAEVAAISAGELRVALHVRHGPGLFGEVVKLFHPAFGVAAGAGGDIVQLPASAIGGCDPALEFLEARVDAILAPDAEYPGGALRIVPDASLHDAAAAPLQAACFASLASRAAAAPVGGLQATVRARELLLTGTGRVGYAGRPSLGATYALQYPAEGEDALAARCPLAGWDGTYPVPAEALSCGSTPCNAPADCEALVLARKVRRLHHGYEACTTDDAGPPPVPDPCVLVAGDPVRISGPALELKVDLQQDPDDGVPDDPAARPARDATVALVTTSGVTALSHRASAGSPYLATSAIAFDRSTDNAPAGYRFLVSYGADLVLDVTPHVDPVEGIVVR